MGKLRLALIFVLGYLLATVIFAISYEIDKQQHSERIDEKQVKKMIGQYCASMYIDDKKRVDEPKTALYKIQKGPDNLDDKNQTIQIYYLKKTTKD